MPMTRVDDIQGFSQQYRNQRRKLTEADIDERDREKIKQFIRDQDTNKGLKESTLINHLGNLRLTAERTEISLVDMEKEDVDDYLYFLKRDEQSSDGTIRNYKKSLRKFFRYIDRNWADDIKVGSPPKREVQVDNLLTDDEFIAMLNSAPNPRDKALFTMLLDTGLRIGAVGSLRIRDVDVEGRAGSVSLNQNANGLKGASGSLPLTWSKGYIGNWLDVHPERDNEDAPLFYNTSDKQIGDAEENDPSLSYYHLQRRLKQMADTAGVDTDKVNPHNLRKTAITWWIRDGFTEQEIKHRATWVKDSTMFEIYSQVTDEEMNEQILNRYGLAEDDEPSRPELDRCSQCRTTLPSPTPRFCPGCGAALSQKAADEVEDLEEDIFSDAVEAEDENLAEALQEFRDLVNRNPTLKDALVDE
jgi:integrase